METETFDHNLSQDDERALRVGKYILKVCSEIFEGKHPGKTLIVPILYETGMVKASFDTVPTKVETEIQFDDMELPFTVFKHYWWDSLEQRWRLTKP